MDNKQLTGLLDEVRSRYPHHYVRYGYNNTGGKLSEDMALIFSVKKKVAIHKLSKEDIIPATIKIGGQVYSTDVVEETITYDASSTYPRGRRANASFSVILDDFTRATGQITINLTTAITQANADLITTSRTENWRPYLNTTLGGDVLEVLSATTNTITVQGFSASGGSFSGPISTSVQDLQGAYLENSDPNMGPTGGFAPGRVLNGLDRRGGTNQRIIGGLSVGNTAGFAGNANELGTLGFLAESDDSTGAVLGISNAHVLNNDNQYITTTVGSLGSGADVSYPNEGLVTSFGRPASEGIIGGFWRHVPIELSPTATNNTVDCACVALNPNTFDNTSVIQSNLDDFNTTFNGTFPEWATDTEIDSLIGSSVATSPNIYSTGARSGARGEEADFRMRATGMGDVPINDGSGGTFQMSQAVIVQAFNENDFATSCPGVSGGGNSGSAVYADVGGAIKLVGLLYAGNSTGNNQTMIFCRITRVAERLNIRRWTGGTNTVDTSNPIRLVIAGAQTQETIAPGDTLHPGGTDTNTYYFNGLTTDSPT